MSLMNTPLRRCRLATRCFDLAEDFESQRPLPQRVAEAAFARVGNRQPGRGKWQV
jgi:hypothetical protein